MTRATRQQLIDENIRLRESRERLSERITKHRNDAVRLRNILAQLVRFQDAEERDCIDDEGFCDGRR